MNPGILKEKNVLEAELSGTNPIPTTMQLLFSQASTPTTVPTTSGSHTKMVWRVMESQWSMLLLKPSPSIPKTPSSMQLLDSPWQASQV